MIKLHPDRKTDEIFKSPLSEAEELGMRFQSVVAKVVDGLKSSLAELGFEAEPGMISTGVEYRFNARNGDFILRVSLNKGGSTSDTEEVSGAGVEFVDPKLIGGLEESLKKLGFKVSKTLSSTQTEFTLEARKFDTMGKEVKMIISVRADKSAGV